MAETYIDAKDDKAALEKFNSCDAKGFNWLEDGMRPNRITYEVVKPDVSKVISRP